MAGVKKLRKVYLGLESTKGTAVPATAQWFGPGTFDDQREIVLRDDDVGYGVQIDQSYSPKVAASVMLDEAPASFEQSPYPFSAGLDDTVSGAANGGTSNGYNYVYTPTPTGIPDNKAYTFEGGDNQQAYEYEYGVCQEINLSGAPGEAVKMSSSWFARQVTKTTFTGSIAVPTIEEILFQKGKLYCDAVGGTLGATQLSGTWLGFDLKIITGLFPSFHGDGNLYFGNEDYNGAIITGSLTFKNDDIGEARNDDFVAQTTKKFRMLFLGSALTGSGGTFTTKALQLDFSGKLTKVDPLGEVNGIDILKVSFQAVYNATASLYFVATVCNLLAALP